MEAYQLDNWIQIKKDPPHDKDIWVKAFSLNRNNKTGEVRRREEYLLWVEGSGPNTYIWDEGNFACDCNRKLFFCRAGNEDEPEEIPCGDGKYSVNIYNSKNNECIHHEFDCNLSDFTQEMNP